MSRAFAAWSLIASSIQTRRAFWIASAVDVQAGKSGRTPEPEQGANRRALPKEARLRLGSCDGSALCFAAVFRHHLKPRTGASSSTSKRRRASALRHRGAKALTRGWQTPDACRRLALTHCRRLALTHCRRRGIDASQGRQELRCGGTRELEPRGD